MKVVRRKLGLIVNPVAGIGGRVGLKGSDGEAVQQQAIKLGAVPGAAVRAERALSKLIPYQSQIILLTCAGAMGEESARKAGWEEIRTIARPDNLEKTTPNDTHRAAAKMLELGANLILFAGGDGTARDLAQVVGEELPVIGIPAGVKIHSGVYSTSPETAGDLVIQALAGQVSFRTGEVMDIDEDLFRLGQLRARLYGYMKVPYRRNLVQGAKAGSEPGSTAALKAIAREVMSRIDPGVYLILGPGTTTRTVAEMLGVEKTLLGVDVIRNGEVILGDAGEKGILDLLANGPAKIVVTPIGGQGHIFGRGNQQISAEVIRLVGKENILVISANDKIHALRGRPLFTDTGDRSLDKELSGYIRVITGDREEIVYPLAC